MDYSFFNIFDFDYNRSNHVLVEKYLIVFRGLLELCPKLRRSADASQQPEHLCFLVVIALPASPV